MSRPHPSCGSPQTQKKETTMPTLTGYENRVLAFRDDRYPNIGKRTAKTIARMLYERQARMSNEDLERIFMHADIVPPAAFKRIKAKEELAKRGVVFA